MNFRITTIEPFDREIKRLAREYRSLPAEFTQLVAKLQANPTAGTPLGQNCYKIRLKIASKGSSGGGGQLAVVVANLLHLAPHRRPGIVVRARIDFGVKP